MELIWYVRSCVSRKFCSSPFIERLKEFWGFQLSNTLVAPFLNVGMLEFRYHFWRAGCYQGICAKVARRNLSPDSFMNMLGCKQPSIFFNRPQTIR